MDKTREIEENKIRSYVDQTDNPNFFLMKIWRKNTFIAFIYIIFSLIIALYLFLHLPLSNNDFELIFAWLSIVNIRFLGFSLIFLEIIGDDPKMNLILNNIEKAQKNLNLIIENIKNKNNDEKDLFLYYEVLGDLYLHFFIDLKKCEYAVEKSFEFLNRGYYYYLISYKYKEIVEKENPITSFDGLHGWAVFKIFVEFFSEFGAENIHNVI